MSVNSSSEKIEGVTTGRHSSPDSRAGRSRSPQRISSPNRLRSLIERGLIKEDDPTYQSAMSKIYEASWRFDRSKDNNILNILDNRELFPAEFRKILRAGLDCKLTNDELETVMPLFNNNGLVDGSEFLLLFYRLRYEHRATSLTERVTKDKKFYEELKAEQQKKKTDLTMKKNVALPSSFTVEDLKSAKDKMIMAAMSYDKTMPGAIPLDAFNVERLNAGEFREQMKNIFRCNLTLPELAAFLQDFNKDKTEEDRDHINCASFLVLFFRMGYKEKTRRIKAVQEERKRQEETAEKKLLEEAKEIAKKNALKVSMQFTPEDKETAVAKLRAAAKLYDKTTPGAMSMKAFEVKEMPPHVFKEQLKRLFNLNVTPAELGALMNVFDGTLQRVYNLVSCGAIFAYLTTAWNNLSL